jgi:hypothetical protein
MNDKNIFLNFDTINSDYSLSNNPYDTKFDIIPPIRKCNKIYLKSIELPVGFCNVRGDNGSTLNKLSWKIGSTTYAFTLSNNIYTSITSLLTDINTKITSLSLGFSMTFSVSPSNSNLVILMFSTSTTITIYPTQLSQYILGLDGTYTGTVITGTQNYLLNVDNYVNLNFVNLPCMSHNNANNILQSFKVPLNCPSNVVYYQAEYNNFAQYLGLSDTNYIIERLQVQITDRFGNVINANGLDWSCSLMFECN